MAPPRADKLLKLLLFSFFLVLSIAQELKHCPHNCECVRNAVRCVHKKLEKIPQAAPDTHTLDLRFNRIQEINQGSFKHLNRLRSLLLNDNQLVKLTTGNFHGLRRLKYLYLYRNKIQSIDAYVFQGLKHLEQLYLHVNEIYQFDPHTFANLPNLERLYLHNNHLTNIISGSFDGSTRIRKLRLDSNPLICDCLMIWFVRYLKENPEVTATATCYGPSYAIGRSISDMLVEEFHCREPTIKREPEDVTVDLGGDALFSCSVSGVPAPEIVWFRDSNEIPPTAHRYEVMSNGSLMIHKADDKDHGFFECVAINPVGVVRSRQARMIVHNSANNSDLPVFTIKPKNILTRIGERSVIFDCMAVGTPSPHIVWLFNNKRLLLDARVSMHRNGSMTIQNVQDSDVGEYTCRAENANGKNTVIAKLELMNAPAFITLPVDKAVTVGETVTFFCNARGNPEPNITWYKESIRLATNTNIVLNNGSRHLTIIAVSNQDDGTYQCRAENSEGLTEIAVLLKVLKQQATKPHIVIKPENTDAFKETSVLLPCEGDSKVATMVEWRKDGSRVVLGKRFRITITGSLIINNLTVADSGRYECTITNKNGRDTASAFLTVKDRVLPGDEYINIALTQATRDIDLAIERTMLQMFNDTNEANKSMSDLYQIIRFPDAPARELARAAEIYERTLIKLREFINNGLKINSTEPFNYHNVLSPKRLEIIAKLSGCTAHREEKDCSDVCYHNKYRNIDGSCNNIDNPMWGASLTAFRRSLFPIYENGFSQPVGWDKKIKYYGFGLPSARLISSYIITTNKTVFDIIISHLVMQWGQWLDHDLDHALPSISSQTWDGVDCKKTCEYSAPCFPIDVPKNDPRINNRRCIDFIRTSAVCGSGMTSLLFGTIQPREQINQLTSFIDASQVYGFDPVVADDLRDKSNDSGLLRVGIRYGNNKPMLPTTGINGMDCRRNVEESTLSCFVAGDIRANEQIGLAAMHTIWMREHNRLATKLKQINPFWDGDRVYQEARKIVGAIMQHITYQHWLPLVLGPEGYKKLGKYESYNPNLNPSISNVFATAALRFGHSMINPILHRYDENFEPIPQGHLLLRDAFFSPWRLVEEGGVDPLLRGMFTTPAKLKTPTQNLNDELTERLFQSAHAVALDLAAINIQRGRDHAIPPYTKWRQFCNMTQVETFEDLKNEITDASVRQKLAKLYGSPHNIDVWVGGILEDQLPGGKVGPLFSCLLIEQFQRLRDGDRFWYENPTTFKPEQLHQIRQTSLARVLCDNGDNIDTISENVFLIPEAQDGLVVCDDIPGINLRHWADCESCSMDDVNDSSRKKRDTQQQDILGMRKVADRLVKQRLSLYENMQNKLEDVVEDLKKKIVSLEESCHASISKACKDGNCNL